MTESNTVIKYTDDEAFLLSHSIENIKRHKKNNAVDSSTSKQIFNEDDRHSDISLDESFKQVTHKKNKNMESIEAVNEFIVTSRTPTRLSHSFIQSWVNTGYLPYQTYINNGEYSGTGSLNPKLSSYITCDIPNATSICKSNGKELCNNSSNCSSVDTAAYILSNTNVKKKTETVAIIMDTKCSSKISFRNTLHGNTSCENTETPVMQDKLNNIVVDSNVSMSLSALNKSNANIKHLKSQRLESKNLMEKELQSTISHSEDDNENEICENNKQGNDINFNNKRKFTQNIMKESLNVGKSLSLPFEGSLNDSRNIRQKKLYSGRDSPTDIIVARFKENDINEMKKDLHPAFRNSPPIEKAQKKILQKKRKTKFCLNNSLNKFVNISGSSDMDKDMHVAKRQRITTDIAKDITEISQNSVNERLFMSCNALKEQIKRFSISDYIIVKNTRQQVTKLNEKKTFGKREQSKNNININLRNALLHENLNPCIILERLSEETLKHYTRKDENTCIQIEELKENDQIENRDKDMDENNVEICSNNTRSTIVLSRQGNINTDIVDSDVSTIIIYNRKDLSSSNHPESDCSTVLLNTSLYLSNTNKTDNNQSDENLNDVKLKRLRPVVVLEQIQIQLKPRISNEIKQPKKIVKRKNAKREKRNRSKKNSKLMSSSIDKRRQMINYNSNNVLFDKILQPVVVLEKCINLEKKVQNQNQIHDISNIHDTICATSSKEKKQLTKLTNIDNKLLKKPIVKLQRLPLMITEYINKLSEMYSSTDKKLNKSDTSNKSNKLNKVYVKRNKRNLNEKNNISTDNSSIDSSEKMEQMKKRRERRKKSKHKKNLPFFRTCENYSDSHLDSDTDFDSDVPVIHCIFNVYDEKNQKRFKRKCSARSKFNQQCMLTDNTDEKNTSMRSKSNSIKNLSIIKNINSVLNHSKSKNINVNMTCSNKKQDKTSMNNITNKNNNSKRKNNIIESDDETFDVNKDSIKRFTFCTKAYDSDSD
ncbi:protein PF14_0175-like isoform X1 [Vespa crabro]|uniref:protein PF14_0175-like isoform X1 n=2 Tax=Vespa crabro TaxID=7445 RepID=UPI001EFFF864|nr:protein PF14_0175-like isoform X1 [Vespa crabro]